MLFAVDLAEAASSGSKRIGLLAAGIGKLRMQHRCSKMLHDIHLPDTAANVMSLPADSDNLMALQSENARLIALLESHGIDWRKPAQHQRRKPNLEVIDRGQGRPLPQAISWTDRRGSDPLGKQSQRQGRLGTSLRR